MKDNKEKKNSNNNISNNNIDNNNINSNNNNINSNIDNNNIDWNKFKDVCIYSAISECKIDESATLRTCNAEGCHNKFHHLCIIDYVAKHLGNEALDVRENDQLCFKCNNNFTKEYSNNITDSNNNITEKKDFNTSTRDYIEGINPERWVQYYIAELLYGTRSNNFVESSNNVNLENEVRTSKPYDALQRYTMYLLQLIDKRLKNISFYFYFILFLFLFFYFSIFVSKGGKISKK